MNIVLKKVFFVSLLPEGYIGLSYLTNPYTSPAMGATAYFNLGYYSYNVPEGDTLRIETAHCIPYDLDSYDLGTEGLHFNEGTFGIGTLGNFRPHEGDIADTAVINNYCALYDGGNYSMSSDLSSPSFDNAFTVEGETLDQDWHVIKASISNQKISFAIDARHAERVWSNSGSGPIGVDVPLMVFGRGTISNLTALPFLGRKKYFKFWMNDVLKCHVVPALDETGRPCMFDLVTKQAFYKVGALEFAAGVETVHRLQMLLAGLPDLTGQAAKALQLDIADDIRTEELEAFVTAEGLKKNWNLSHI